MTGNVYAIVGSRDGVGATTTAVALGTSLAEQSRRVAVIDADFEDEGVGAALDLGDPDLTLRDILRGDADLDDALVETAHGLRVLPSGDAAPAPTDVRSHALVRAADRVRERFDIVLVDLGAAGGTPAAIALERADGALLAATPQDDAIAAGSDTATVARYHGADVLGTVFTTIPEGTEVDHEATAEAIGTDVLAMVPEDDAVAESAETGTSLLRHDPDSSAATVYWELASRLVDGDLGGDPVVYGHPSGKADDQSADGADEYSAGGADERDAAAPEPQPAASRDAHEDTAEQGSANPASHARQDADEQSSSSPRSHAHEDTAEQSADPSTADGSEAGDDEATGEPRAPSQPSQAQDDADARAQAADAAAPDGTLDETVAAGDGESGADAAAAPSNQTSRNEFSWDEDSTDDDSSTVESPDGDEAVPMGGPDDASEAGDDEIGEASDTAEVEVGDSNDEQGLEREAATARAGDSGGDVDAEALGNEADVTNREDTSSARDDGPATDGVVVDDGADADDGDDAADGNEADDGDEVEAAFKATMDKVREQSENEDDESSEDDGDDESSENDGNDESSENDGNDGDDEDDGMFGIGN